MVNKIQFYTLTAALFLAGTVACLFQQAYATANVTFHGTLMEAPLCIINDGKPIVVDFGDEVLTTRVIGGEYQQEIVFTLDCSGAISPNQQLRITGTPASFDPLALAGGKTNLGIALYHGSVRYTPGEWITFTAPSAPKMKAVLTQPVDTSLQSGSFSVLASLVMDYQ